MNPQLKLMKSLRQINENSRKLNKMFVECEWNEEKVHRGGAYKTHSGTAKQSKRVIYMLRVSGEKKPEMDS